MRRHLPLLVAGFLALASLSTGSLAGPAPAAAATLAATTTCANSVDNTPGLGIICEVLIENTITSDGGSASVEVRECHGAAGDPTASCTTDTTTLTEPVTVVNQCNNSTNGGGGTLRCSVEIVNTHTAADPSPTGVTVNQCVGSGDGITVGCDPFPAVTLGATITQCNGSANGLTLVELTCSATGTQSSAFDVTVNQCNNSTNGGGALVICSATIETIHQAPAPPSPSESVPPAAPSSAAPSTAPTAPTAPTATPSTPGANPTAPAANATTPALHPTPPPTDLHRPSADAAADSTAALIAILLAVGAVAGARVLTTREPRA